VVNSNSISSLYCPPVLGICITAVAGTDLLPRSLIQLVVGVYAARIHACSTLNTLQTHHALNMSMLAASDSKLTGDNDLSVIIITNELQSELAMVT